MLGLPTVLGARRSGFFIPCRYAGSASSEGNGYPALQPLFGAAEGRFEELLLAIERRAAALLEVGEGEPPAPRWAQDWFPRLDAAAAWAVIGERRPRRLVEIGSGHSTRFFVAAAAAAALPLSLVAIDPAPRAALRGLGIRLLQEPVQRAGDEPFDVLEPGDVLSLDGSHVLMPGTDVDVVINRILPRLPTGVLVHIHDVFLPDGYPAVWRWRGYNEQSAVGALLQGGGWRVLWSSRWVATRLAERLERTVIARLPLPAGAHESSLWLEKRADAVLQDQL